MYKLFKEAVLASGLDILNKPWMLRKMTTVELRLPFCRLQVISNSFQKQQMGCGQVLDLIVA